MSIITVSACKNTVRRRSMVGSVGTANMDIRSFELNFEVNAVIYSERTVQRLERAFEQDIEKMHSDHRNIYDQRNMMIRAKRTVLQISCPRCCNCMRKVN